MSGGGTKRNDTGSSVALKVALSWPGNGALILVENANSKLVMVALNQSQSLLVCSCVRQTPSAGRTNDKNKKRRQSKMLFLSLANTQQKSQVTNHSWTTISACSMSSLFCSCAQTMAENSPRATQQVASVSLTFSCFSLFHLEQHRARREPHQEGQPLADCVKLCPTASEFWWRKREKERRGREIN